MRKEDTPKLSELCIVAMVGEISDRFGLAPTRGGKQTASGKPLPADADTTGAKDWARGVTAKFKWMLESDTELSETEVPSVIALIRAAFDGDEKAAAELRVHYLS